MDSRTSTSDTDTTLFYYEDSVIDSFPLIRAGVAHAADVQNAESKQALTQEYAGVQAEVLEEIGDTPLSEIHSIAAWRRVFRSFGVKPTQYRNAAESLLRRLTKKGDIPSISPIVDLGNMVSIRYALPVAFFDLDGIEGSSRVTFAEGAEAFTDLGSQAPVNPEKGEVVFVDDAEVVSARRWCWRQSAQSATSAATKEVLITVEGHHEGAEEDVLAALDDIVGGLDRYGLAVTVSTGRLSATSPTFRSS